MVGVPDHVPVPPLRVSPSRAVPESDGLAWLTGGVAATFALAADVADVAPAAFVAVTTTRIVAPTSFGPRAYVALVARRRRCSWRPPRRSGATGRRRPWDQSLPRRRGRR